MKKAIAILLVLLVAGVAFGATDATTGLDLKTSVGSRFGLYITADSVADPTDKVGFDALSTVVVGTATSPLIFSDENLSESLKVHLMTNKNSAYNVTVSADLLKSGSNTTTIGYTVAPTAQATVVVSADGSDIILHSIVASPGLDIDSNVFTITMDETDWNNAEEGDYTTTWSVNLTTV